MQPAATPKGHLRADDRAKKVRGDSSHLADPAEVCGSLPVSATQKECDATVSPVSDAEAEESVSGNEGADEFEVEAGGDRAAQKVAVESQEVEAVDSHNRKTQVSAATPPRVQATAEVLGTAAV